MHRLAAPGSDPAAAQHLRFFEDFIECNSYAPTLREIGAAVGLKSTSSVSYQVQKLRKMGHLSRDFGRPRTTVPTRAVRPQSHRGRGGHGRTLVPVISRTAAGGTVTAVDLTGWEEYVHVPSGIVGAHEHFALEVAGDSMIGKAIIDGDRVVVRRGCEVRSGDTREGDQLTLCAKVMGRKSGAPWTASPPSRSSRCAASAWTRSPPKT